MYSIKATVYTSRGTHNARRLFDPFQTKFTSTDTRISHKIFVWTRFTSVLWLTIDWIQAEHCVTCSTQLQRPRTRFQCFRCFVSEQHDMFEVIASRKWTQQCQSNKYNNNKEMATRATFFLSLSVIKSSCLFTPIQKHHINKHTLFESGK